MNRWLVLSACATVMMGPNYSSADPPEAAAIASDTASAPTSTAESIAAGETLYQQFCSGCHGVHAEGGHQGEGNTKAPPSLIDSTWTHGSSDGAIFRTIKAGIAPEYAMVPWDGVISDEDIWKIIHYIKSLGKK